MDEQLSGCCSLHKGNSTKQVLNLLLTILTLLRFHCDSLLGMPSNTWRRRQFRNDTKSRSVLSTGAEQESSGCFGSPSRSTRPRLTRLTSQTEDKELSAGKTFISCTFCFDCFVTHTMAPFVTSLVASGPHVQYQAQTLVDRPNTRRATL